MDLPRLADHLASLGFGGVELPVREGYQVTPEGIGRGLPSAVSTLSAAGLICHSIASDPDEQAFAACGEAGVGLIRIQVPVPIETGYFGTLEEWRRRLDRLEPLCDRYSVGLGIQIHSGRFLARSTEVMQLIERYAPEHVSLVWDAGHAFVSGEDPEYAMATCRSHLSLVNFKNYRYEQTDPSQDTERETVARRPVPCRGGEGLASWRDAVEAVDRIGYTGPFCISAQYPQGSDVDVLARLDRDYLASIIGA